MPNNLRENRLMKEYIKTSELIEWLKGERYKIIPLKQYKRGFNTLNE